MFTLSKKVNEKWNLVNKNEQSTFHISKPGHFNSSTEVIFITVLNLKLIEEKSQCQTSVAVIIHIYFHFYFFYFYFHYLLLLA